MANHLCDCISEALHSATTTPPSQNTNTGGRRPPLSVQITNLIAEKRALRRQWQSTRFPVQKNRLNSMAERIKSALDDHANESWNRHMESVGEHMPSVHRLCKQISAERPPVKPLLDTQGHLHFRAEIFANHPEKQFTPNPIRNIQRENMVTTEGRKYLEDTAIADEEPVFASPSQVQRVIRQTKTKKAPAADRITNTRDLPLKTVAALPRLFNRILCSGHFPSRWKIDRDIMKR